MIDATHLKAHRTASSLFKKGLFPDISDAPKGPEFQGRCIRRVVFLAFDEWFHVDGRDQANFVSQPLRKRAPEMARGARIHHHDAQQLLVQDGLKLC